MDLILRERSEQRPCPDRDVIYVELQFAREFTGVGTTTAEL